MAGDTEPEDPAEYLGRSGGVGGEGVEMIFQGYAVIDSGTGEFRRYYWGRKGPRIYKTKEKAMETARDNQNYPRAKGEYVLAAVYLAPLAEDDSK